ncbi:MAG: succinylglutamate desuccinylase/aspartoacylase family protein [Melioribacteraceae bacterium]|nr:succinylglutamate desuccinylase/aspartoacylase family protein [Melioribacteraceae bacterium]
MKKIILLTLLVFSTKANSQQFLYKSEILETTSYLSMMDFLYEITKDSEIMKLDYLGVSYLGRKIPYVTINKKTDSVKVKFMIFAQQHGNEPSGKEALLVLFQEISSGLHSKWFNKIELIIVPMVNPDGAELGSRLTANGVDLNRSHVNLRNAEVLGLQNLFYENMPEVTLDIHETNYYRKEWIDWGYIKTSRQNMGIVTNPNIAESIFELSNKKAFPFVKKYVENAGFSFSNYYLGNLYKGEKNRFSNLGIYDGRQSFGIFNTLSFIIEGKNGRSLNDSLTIRRNGQLTNIKGLIEFVYKNCTEIQGTIDSAREDIINSKESDEIVIRSKYVETDSTINLVMHNVNKKEDTLMTFPFGGIVKATLTINKPKGYLIPNNDTLLVALLKKHHIKFEPYRVKENENIFKYKIAADSVQELEKDNFNIEKIKVSNLEPLQFYFVPINQIASNFITLIFEPKSKSGVNSKYGVLSDRKISYYIDGNNFFNILRVETE